LVIGDWLIFLFGDFWIAGLLDCWIVELLDYCTVGLPGFILPMLLLNAIGMRPTT
jgi:hypothetical protein